MEQAKSYLKHQSIKSIPDLAALMERTAGECASCLDGIGEEQASYKPGDEWSVKEILGHMLSSGRGVNREIANLVDGTESAREARMGLAPSDEKPIDELRQALAELWSETGRLVSSLPEEGDLERTWEHPAFGQLNFREWAAFQRLHALDHVQQMEKVKTDPGYPRG
jgi:uncharacterized damage-inducible protein DinB